MSGENMRLVRSFTMTELFVLIAFLGALIALLIPAIKSARCNSANIMSVNNIKQICTAVEGYRVDFDGNIPVVTSIIPNSADYAASDGEGSAVLALLGITQGLPSNTFSCPSTVFEAVLISDNAEGFNGAVGHDGLRRSGYGWNVKYRKYNTRSTPIIADDPSAYKNIYAHVGFSDGHVKKYHVDDAKIRTTLFGQVPNLEIGSVINSPASTTIRY